MGEFHVIVKDDVRRIPSVPYLASHLYVVIVHFYNAPLPRAISVGPLVDFTK
jgi:hypothetical protein